MSYRNSSNFSYCEDTSILEKISPDASIAAGNNSIFLYSCFVLLFRAGFVLVQLASIPTHNVYVIIYQNVVDIALTIAAFGSIGYVLAFGDDIKGIIGYKKWFSFDNETDVHNAIVGIMASLIAIGIVTSILCGRISNFGYFILIFILSGFVLPILIHWVWHSEGWLYFKDFLSTEVSFRDQSGGLIIHVFSGTISLISALFFGRRLILLSAISELSVGVASPGSSFVGYIFIIVGLMGFSLTTFSYDKTTLEGYSSGILIINNLAALSGGILVIIFIQIVRKQPINYWNTLRCIQGGIAGIVTIAPGVDMYTPEVAFAAAAFSSIIFYFVSLAILQKTSIEDYCNVISIHLVCGIIGLTLSPLIGTAEYYTSQSIKFRCIHSLWQFVCTLTVMLFLMVLSMLLFCILLLCKNLRSDSERIDHERGVLAVQNQENDKTLLDRLFNVTPSLSYLEPGASRREPPEIESKKESLEEPNLITETMAVQKKSPPKNLKYIYTITNLDTSGPIIKKDLKGGSGDDSVHKLPDSNSLKNVSYYNLHRTHKSVDLFRKDFTSTSESCDDIIQFDK